MSIPENPWFLQAEDDLKMAKLAFANGFYSQTCYHASQSAEKALKSIIIDLGELPPKTHALNRLKGNNLARRSFGAIDVSRPFAKSTMAS